MKTLVLLATLCGIATAQTFTGTHPTGSTCGDTPVGGTGCVSGGAPYATMDARS